MNITKRLLLLLLVLTVVATPLFSCDNHITDTTTESSAQITETSSPEETVTSSLEETTAPDTSGETENYKEKYKNMTPEEFYADYELAENAADA